MKIVFATNNRNKIKEISEMLHSGIQILSLEDISCFDEIPETAPDIAGNAIQKARYIWDKYQLNCFADDTGLEVESLNNAPGVYSARYAGPEKIDSENIKKLLFEMQDVPTRKARFKTIIALLINGKQTLFEGIVNGEIAHSTEGNGGFGYDPVFIPDGHTRTFAQMSAEEKNAISHRGIAFRKMCDFLNEHLKT